MKCSSEWSNGRLSVWGGGEVSRRTLSYSFYECCATSKIPQIIIHSLESLLAMFEFRFFSSIVLRPVNSVLLSFSPCKRSIKRHSVTRENHVS